MSLIPYTGMIDAALKLKSDAGLWISIGKPSPWSDDTRPPTESLVAESLVETIAFKKVDTTSLAIPDPSGSIVFSDAKYTLVEDGDAIPMVARWCYIRASLNGEEDNHDGPVISTVTFRQMGLYSGLVPAAGFESDTALKPEQVADVGRLIFYSNHIPRTRNITLNDIVEIVVSMIPPAPCEDATTTTSTSTTACTQACQISCQTSCETGGACQTACQSGALCQTTCQASCQAGCQTGTCQTSCQSGSCQTSCETGGSCQTACQSGTVCQSACESGCQACQGVACQACQTTCQLACQACQGVACQACQTGCQLGTACQTVCMLGCQTACQLGTSCQAACQISCQSACETDCQTTEQLACAHSCQDMCETGATCQSSCQLACQTGGQCEAVCQGCQTGCQLSCQPGLQA